MKLKAPQEMKITPTIYASDGSHRARYFLLGPPILGARDHVVRRVNSVSCFASYRTAPLLAANARFVESHCRSSCEKVAQPTTSIGEMAFLVNNNSEEWLRFLCIELRRKKRTLVRRVNGSHDSDCGWHDRQRALQDRESMDDSVHMSRGIIQAALENNKLFPRLDSRELSPSQREISSEQLTVADLVLPGTGHSIAGDFSRLLRVLSAGESS
jgi:hypothetical protein